MKYTLNLTYTEFWDLKDWLDECVGKDGYSVYVPKWKRDWNGEPCEGYYYDKSNGVWKTTYETLWLQDKQTLPINLRINGKDKSMLFKLTWG